MLEFLFAFAYRVISGAQIKYGYQKSAEGMAATTCAMLFMGGLVLVTTLVNSELSIYIRCAAALFAFAAMVSAIAVRDSFDPGDRLFPKDVHLYETITTGALVVAMCLAGHNIIMVAASVYPALILHKALINSAFGKPWTYHGTDDKTGKTFGIPLLGIKIPRNSLGLRVALALGSIALAIVATWQGWSVAIAIR